VFTHIERQLGVRRGSARHEPCDRGKPKRHAYIYYNMQDLAHAEEASLLTNAGRRAMTRGRCRTLIGGRGGIGVEATMDWQ
jgi:hypothetical protein